MTLKMIPATARR